MTSLSSTSSLLSLLQSSARSGPTGTDSLLDGVFKKMLDPVEFKRLVYPGLRAAELRDLPSSLQEVLCEAKYSTEVAQLVPVAQAKARSVLDGVKQRAAADGEFMDAETEASLYPAVFTEAFARALVTMVTTAARSAQAIQAKSGHSLASPYAPQALWAQIPPDALTSIMSDGSGYAVIDGFCGAGWPQLYVDDLTRLAAAGRLTPRSSQASLASLASVSFPLPLPRSYPSVSHTGDIVDVPLPSLAVLDLAEVTEEYPALADLLERLHAIPFELNRAANLHLTEPVGRSTAVRSHAVSGCLELPTVDSGPPSSTTDAGYKLTATYFIAPAWSPDAGALFGLARDGVPYEWIQPTSDRLVIHRSRQLQHVSSPYLGSSTVWSITFHMHGSDDSFV